MGKPSAVAVVFLLTTLACGQAASTPTAMGTAPSPTEPAQGAAAPMTIAIEYAIPGLAAAYRETGVSYAKLQPAFGVWGNLESQPGEYQWAPLDDLVEEYQSAGYTGIQILISADNPWASIRPVFQGDTFPKEKYVDDYVAMVKALVERYDGDGVDDAPGLLYAVHHYGIEREFTGFWPGTTESYVQLLRLAYPAVHEADEKAQVLLVALLMVDIFDGNPDPAEVQRRLLSTKIGKSLDETLEILSACDAYDIVDFHSLGDYQEIVPTAAWIREQLARKGCDKPLWIGDSFSMSALIGYGGFVPATPFAPATLQTRDQVVETLSLVADPRAEGHDQAVAWLQAEMARGLVHKIVAAAGAGTLGINIGNMEDWKTGIAELDKLSVPAMGTSMFMGMLDTALGGRAGEWRLPYMGETWDMNRVAGEPRPVLYALELVMDKLGRYSSVERLNLGENVWSHRFQNATGPLWVMWYDDGELYLPGEALPTMTVELPFEGDQARLTWTPTAPGQADPESVLVDVTGGALTLQLDTTPVFVELP